ncbi:MAG TPA: ABC transporter ATP-binding protein, partial [Ruminococcaceae bacterium]|nr:ABC transporter ATP-binding protein [Oscillospiraceae bacterium]
MLKLSHVYKTFNKGTVNEKQALIDINLQLNPGDFVTIIGGNGAGKSTLLNLIAGVYPCDGGNIFVDDTDVTRLKEYKRARFLGRVFQDPMRGTAGDMNIEENLAIAYRRGKPRTLRWGITPEERKLYHDRLSTLDLGLEDRMTSKVGLLSGGQRQA